MANSVSDLPAQAIEALRNGDKIAAIKYFRNSHGIGLKEAKDAVEAHLAANPALAQQFQLARSARPGHGAAWIVLLLVAIVVVLFIRRQME